MGAEARANQGKRFRREPVAPVVNIAQARSKRESIQPNRKIGIFVAVPTGDGKVHFSIPILFAKLMASNGVAECPFRFVVHVEPGKKGIDYARNCIVRTFLGESDCDWLVMIDADEVVDEEFWKLCTVSDSDVVGGITPVWVGNMDPEIMLRVNNYGVDSQGQCYNLPAPADGLKSPYRVPVLGTGCIAIRRRVFAPKPLGVGDTPFYFTHMPDRKIMGGEDVNFSVECQRAGFTLAVHPDVFFDHMKEIPLGQIERYYRARKAMEMAGRQPSETQRLSIG